VFLCPDAAQFCRYQLPPEDGGSMFIRNTHNHPHDYTVLQPRRSSHILNAVRTSTLRYFARCAHEFSFERFVLWIIPHKHKRDLLQNKDKASTYFTLGRVYRACKCIRKPTTLDFYFANYTKPRKINEEQNILFLNKIIMSSLGNRNTLKGSRL
jgi:hypothetical protein